LEIRIADESHLIHVRRHQEPSAHKLLDKSRVDSGERNRERTLGQSLSKVHSFGTRQFEAHACSRVEHREGIPSQEREVVA
jgi:hypothetical protein